MRLMRVVLAVLAVFASSALYAQHDYVPDGAIMSPDSDKNFIMTGTPCELGSEASLQDLGPHEYFVRAGKEQDILYNFYGKTNFDCHDGEGVRETSPGKKLKYGEVLVARWDTKTCAWDYSSLRLKKCYKTFSGNPPQVFIPDPMRKPPPFVIARDLDPRPIPTCDRADEPAAKTTTEYPDYDRRGIPADTGCELPKVKATNSEFEGKSSIAVFGEAEAAEEFRIVVVKQGDLEDVVYASRWNRVNDGSRRVSEKVTLSDLNNDRRSYFRLRFEVRNKCGHDEDIWRTISFNPGRCNFGSPRNPITALVRGICRNPVQSFGLVLAATGTGLAIRNNSGGQNGDDGICRSGRCSAAGDHPKGDPFPTNPNPPNPSCATCNQQPGQPWPSGPGTCWACSGH